MITYETNHLVDKFLSDMDYQVQNPSGQAKLAEKSEYATVEWEFKRGDMLTQALKKHIFNVKWKN